MELCDTEGTHKVQLWLQQRGKKRTVTVQGLDDDLDLHRIARHIRRSMKVSAAVVEDKATATEAQAHNRHTRNMHNALDLESLCKVQTGRGDLPAHGMRRLYLPSHQVLLVSGDKRREIVEFLLQNQIVLDATRIVLHGYQ